MRVPKVPSLYTDPDFLAIVYALRNFAAICALPGACGTARLSVPFSMAETRIFWPGVLRFRMLDNLMFVNERAVGLS